MEHAAKFVIIGAGNGGQSLAGDLAERGFHVAALYNRFPEALEHVQQRGGVELVGPVRSRLWQSASHDDRRWRSRNGG